MTITSRISGTQLDRAIQLGMSYLLRHQNPDGSFAVLNDLRFKTWETALSLLLLSRFGDEYEELAKAASAYLHGVMRDDGSVMHSNIPEIVADEENFCVETTSMMALALQKWNFDASRSVRFLEEKQLSDGSWDCGTKGIPQPIRRYVSVAGHVVRTLIACGGRESVIERGLGYIEGCQESDGLWGKLMEAYDSPSYAALVCLGSLHLAERTASSSFRNAIDAIQRSQNPDGSWERFKPGVPSQELRSALALNCLLVAPEASAESVVAKGTRWLIDCQLLWGSWHGGYFGINEPDKNEDLVATIYCLLALTSIPEESAGRRTSDVPKEGFDN